MEAVDVRAMAVAPFEKNRATYIYTLVFTQNCIKILKIRKISLHCTYIYINCIEFSVYRSIE